MAKTLNYYGWGSRACVARGRLVRGNEPLYHFLFSKYLARARHRRIEKER